MVDSFTLSRSALPASSTRRRIPHDVSLDNEFNVVKIDLASGKLLGKFEVRLTHSRCCLTARCCLRPEAASRCTWCHGIDIEAATGLLLTGRLVRSNESSRVDSAMGVHAWINISMRLVDLTGIEPVTS